MTMKGMLLMHRFLHKITDYVSSKKGMWITVGIWLAATIILSVLAPSARDYEVSRLEPFPDDMQSVIAEQKLDHYFKDTDNIPAILVFQSEEKNIQPEELYDAVKVISDQQIHGLEHTVPIDKMHPEALQAFLSDDETTALMPMNFNSSLDTDEIKDSIEQIYEVNKSNTDLELFVTGP